MQLSGIPDDADLITIAAIAIANDDEVLDTIERIRSFRPVRSEVAKMQGWGIFRKIRKGIRKVWKHGKGWIINKAINALKGRVAAILNRHPTVKRYVQKLVCGY